MRARAYRCVYVCAQHVYKSTPYLVLQKRGSRQLHVQSLCREVCARVGGKEGGREGEREGGREGGREGEREGERERGRVLLTAMTDG